MADAFSRLIELTEKYLAPVDGRGSELWSARHPGSRAAIRESIKSTFNGWSGDDIETVLDLEHPPRPFARSVSVSHTHDFGGWLAITRPAQIGWDIELKTRIKDHIIERVCAKDELSSVPLKPLLWPAKEAFFKALEDEQPEVIHQVTITDWKALIPGVWSFRGLGPRNGEGLVLDLEPWLLASCLIR